MFHGKLSLVDDVFKLLHPGTAKKAFQGLNKGILFNPNPKGVFDAFHSMGGLIRQPMPIFLPLAALAFASAPQGHKVSNAVGHSSSMILSAVPGALLGGTIGSMATSVLLDNMIAGGIERTISKIGTFGRRVARPKMGGDYIDTQQAYTMRQRAKQEMSNSLLNARQYLGTEARLFHS